MARSDTVISFDVIKKLKILDLRPLLASGKYDDVVSRVLEWISFSEYIT